MNKNKNENTPFNKIDASCQTYVLYASPIDIAKNEIMLRNYMYDIAKAIDDTAHQSVVVPHKFSAPASKWYGSEQYKPVDNPYFINIDKGLIGVCIDAFAIDMKCMLNTFKYLYNKYEFPFDSRLVTAYFDSFFVHVNKDTITFDTCMSAIIKQRIYLNIGMILPKKEVEGDTSNE